MPKFSTKREIRTAIENIENAETALEWIRTHFNLEWGENANCPLDVNLSGVIRKLQEANQGLNELLVKNRGRAVSLKK